MGSEGKTLPNHNHPKWGRDRSKKEEEEDVQAFIIIIILLKGDESRG